MHTLLTLQQQCATQSNVRAAALFGSTVSGARWQHSDIDLFLLMEQDDDLWDAITYEVDGQTVHAQRFSRRTLHRLTDIVRGSALTSALAGATLWFDHGGELRRAIANARAGDANTRDLSLLRETARCVAALHQAERHLAFERDREARFALVNALAAQVALLALERGALPPRDPWTLPSEPRDTVDALLAGAPVSPTLTRMWGDFRGTLAVRAAPLLSVLRSEGPLDAAALRSWPLFTGMAIEERLLAELVDAGLLETQAQPDPQTGLPVRTYQRTNLLRPDVFPAGISSLHLSEDTLNARMASAPALPKNTGQVVRIVQRIHGGARFCPPRATLCTTEGLVGDAWFRKHPTARDEQVAVMNATIAQVAANGQPIEILGDNLFIDLDTSSENLPPGTLLTVGTARVVVTPEPHNPCNKLAARLGNAALHWMARKDERHLNRRGVYWEVLQSGEVWEGAPIVVESRPGGTNP